MSVSNPLTGPTWEEIKQWIRDACPSWFQWVLAPIIALVDAIIGAWRALRDAFKRLWKIFKASRLYEFGRWLLNRMSDWSSWLATRLNRWSNWLSSRLNNWGHWIITRMNDWSNWLATRLNRWSNWLSSRLNNWGHWIISRLNDWSNWLSTRLNRWSNWLVSRLNNWGSWLIERLSSWGSWLVSRLSNWGSWLSNRLWGWRSWLSNRLNDWGAWLGDRHQELVTFLYGEEGVVTGAINELREWVEDLLDLLIREVILHIMDWMGFVAPPIEELDELAPHFSPFTNWLDEIALAWKEKKEEWVMEAMEMMEALAAELRGEEEMIPKTPSQIFWENWFLLPDDVKEMINQPPIKG